MVNKNNTSMANGDVLNVLVACEESQIVTIALRALGHNAFSCDIIQPSGGHPEWHIQADVLPLINGRCSFTTMDGTMHSIPGKWDLLIAFPPCTHLCNSGARWFTEGKKPLYLREQAAEFFMRFANADCDHIAIENPVGIMSTRYRKPNQIIQPWQFGHGETKSTCLWLKNLPLLIPTNIVEGREHRIHRLPPSPNRAKLRSKTYPGIGQAMAQQWSEAIIKADGCITK